MQAVGNSFVTVSAYLYALVDLAIERDSRRVQFICEPVTATFYTIGLYCLGVSAAALASADG